MAIVRIIESALNESVHRAETNAPKCVPNFPYATGKKYLFRSESKIFHRTEHKKLAYQRYNIIVKIKQNLLFTLLLRLFNHTSILDI